MAFQSVDELLEFRIKELPEDNKEELRRIYRSDPNPLSGYLVVHFQLLSEPESVQSADFYSLFRDLAEVYKGLKYGTAINLMPSPFVAPSLAVNALNNLGIVKDITPECLVGAIKQYWGDRAEFVDQLPNDEKEIGTLMDGTVLHLILSKGFTDLIDELREVPYVTRALTKFEQRYR